MFKIFTNIGKDALVLAIGTMSTSALAFFMMPLYTRVFSTEEYGIIEIVNITAQMVGIIMALGMPSAFNRDFLQISDTEEQRMETLSTSFLFISVFSFFVCVVAFALSNYLASWLNLVNPEVPSLFRLIFIKTYFMTLGLISLRYIIVTRKMTVYAFLSFLMAALIMLVSIWVLLIQNNGLYELFFYQTIIVAIFGISYSVFVLYRAGIRWSNNRLRGMLVFALPMVPSAISFYIMTSSDRFFLQQMASTADVGIYGVAYRIGLLISVLLIGPLTTSLSPYIYRIAKRDDCGDVIQHMFSITTFIFMAGAVGLSLASPYVIRLLAPEPYWSASSVVIWISLAYALYGFNFVLVAGINISGKSYYQMFAIAIAAILNLFLNFLLIPYWGISGAAIATTIACFVQTLFTGIFAQRIYPMPYKFIRALMIAGTFIFSYWALNLIPVNPLITTVIIKIIVYCLILTAAITVFFKKESLAVWDKIRIGFVFKNQGNV